MAVDGLAQTAQLRRFIGWHGPGCPLASTLLFYGVAFAFLISGTVHPVEAQELTPEPVYRNETINYICKSVDVRNSLDAFSKLENCKVIEGFLQILLFDNVSESEFLKIQFPLLTEITDYLLLYRVSGLRSIGQLFPNLAVIRGQNLLFSNAFVIFEMSSLQEIGLYSLTDITHGVVHIDKNPSLCFVHTIDWDRIVHDKSEKNFIKSLKPENECPICPGDMIVRANNENNSITVACPKAPKLDGENSDKDKHLCWNKNHCQKICPRNCTSCNDHGQCCNPLCLGGCANHDPNECTVCRNFTIELGRKRKCTQSCPPNYFKYLDRRCITKEECINMPKPMEYHVANDVVSYKIFNQSCILHCPSNYKSVNNTCIHCGGRCEKICDGINIDSIALAKQLRGCTHIKGSLEIQIRGGSNVVNVLEENLSMIEEISGYLKVVRSYSLVSLNFLKNLKRIKGEKLESQKNVFVVLDNQNLQELFDLDNRTVGLRIDNGSLFFHFNPKLCINKIEKLQKVAMPHLPHFTDHEVAPNSNGDKIACDVKDLPINITQIHSNYVTLEWNKFQMEDERSLLAYTVYFIEAPFRNISLYDRRDACGQDNWRVYDVPNHSAGETKIVHPLPNLKPFTQYAVYVKTYTLASERTGGRSAIKYFRTNASMPTPPQNVQVISNSSNSLKISWLPPAEPNGHITHYIVSGKKHSNGDIYLKDRNYCKDPPTKTEAPQVIQPTLSPKRNDSCVCAENPERTLSINEMEESARVKFEDELQNKVYIRRKDAIRTKRQATPNTFPNNTENPLPNYTNREIKNVTENGTDIWESFSFPVYGKTEFFIDKLHHFTSYVINVQACREQDGPTDVESRCSSTSMQLQRTLKKRGADRITKVHVTNQSLDTVTIAWEPPSDPNGVIFSISVEYKRVDIDNAKANPECITSNDFKNSTSYRIVRLIPGNYSLRVFATTSAGEGEYSPTIYFYINETSNTVVIVSVVLFIFLGIFLFIGWFYWKHQKEKENMRLIQSVNPEYVPSVYVPDEWEVPRKKIDLIKELGQGSFGMVWEGLAHDIRGQLEVRCAIKTVNEHATNRERLEFLNEASVMKAFDTSHVVKLLGVVSQGQPTLVVMELMAHGDLKSYLRSHRPDIDNYDPSLIKHPPSLKQILQMAIEIADGMAYLSAKKFVHRDLAARNCMVSEEFTVKIGDFGMTRDIYETDYYRKGTKGLLPVRWMAPESLKDGVFTSSSDVWSYGVVLWEMATLASQPYQGLSNDQVLRYVIDGGVMERPENCPDKLYTLMRYCWQHKSSARPTFLKLCQLLLDDASPTFAQVSFYHSPAGAEARASRPTPSPSQDDHPTTPLRKVSDRLGGYTPSESQDSDELDIDTHHQFPSISESGVGVTATANGYVSGCPTGASTTQC